MIRTYGRLLLAASIVCVVFAVRPAHGAAATGAWTAYVANEIDGTITPINLTTGATLARFADTKHRRARAPCP